MKKLFGCAAVIFCLANTPASAWDASYLLQYPEPIQAGNWLLDVGVGFGLGGANTLIPPILFTFEYALPLGGLPFSLGGLVGFAWSHYEGNSWYYSPSQTKYIQDWFHIPVGFRIAYHFNWGVKNLDTYVTTTLGADIMIYDGYHKKPDGSKGASYDNTATAFDWLMIGTHIGARYYFTPMIGAFLELGGWSPHYAALGLALKF
ncbi:MAG: hypothetical protein LBD13_08455 [Spirochaetaceae bacterium]|jgi:hypothetical protein|nr:hypothetical protein [Spirochaetaceae bacterium]